MAEAQDDSITLSPDETELKRTAAAAAPTPGAGGNCAG